MALLLSRLAHCSFQAEETGDQLLGLSRDHRFVGILPIVKPDVEGHKKLPAILRVKRDNNPRTLETLCVALLRDWPDHLIWGVRRIEGAQ